MSERTRLPNRRATTYRERAALQKRVRVDAPQISDAPRRLSLADLKAAACARRQGEATS